MKRMHTTTRRLAAVGAGIAVATGLVACGDNGATPAAANPDIGSDDDLAPFCDSYDEISILLDDDEPEVGRIADLRRVLEQEMPPALADSLPTMLAAVDGALAGDPAGFETPSFAAAQSAVERFLFDSCPADGRVEVTAVDYGFEGLPTTLPPGVTSFLLTNATTHDEPHAFDLYRIPDDVDEPATDIVARGADAIVDLLEPVDDAFALPGEQGSIRVELETGRYVVVCPIPFGGFDGPEGAELHLSGGMVAEFEVTP